MSDNNRLPVGCLPKSTKCLVLQDGTPLDQAIGELQEGLSCKDSSNDCESSVVVDTSTPNSTDIGNISTAGVGSTKTVPTPISISVKPGNNDTLISYDLSEAVASCNCANTSPRITFTDKDGNRICTNTNLSGSERLSPNQTPSTFSAEVICNKPTGQEVLSYQGKISNTSIQGYLQSTSLRSTGSLETQTNVNEHFDSCISGLKSQVDSLTNVSHNGVTGIVNIVCDLEEKINSSLSSDFTDQTINCEGSGVSLTETICSLLTRITTLEEQNQTLADEVSRLNSQYNTLYTLLTNK